MADRRRFSGAVGALAALLAAGAALAACTASAATGSPTSRPAPATSHPTTPRPRTTSTKAARRATEAMGGRLLLRRIPGLTSHFRARRAYVWLPPVLSERSSVRLPVVLLLHGLPGHPADWVRKGDAVRTLDAFAAKHGGRAPIVVMPDINGATRADTECITTKYGADVERYLTVDVPRWVRAHYPTRTDGRWGVAGLSEGGTCAAMLALRHPDEFSVFGDFSGLARPTLGDTDDPATTIRVLFHGDRAAYERHDPMWLLAHHRYPHGAGWLEYGRQDVKGAAAAKSIAGAARRARLTIRVSSVPGRHEWTVWQAAFRSMLPWLWQRIG